MAKAKFNFKKLEKEIKYLAIDCGYCDENGNFPDFEEEEEDGSVSIDNVPWTIGEFEKKGYKYGGSWYHVSSEFGTEDSELQFHYCFYPDCNCITIEGETFSMKECMIVINMVMKQLEDNKHSYCISYGFEGDESFQSFHHDASHFAMWWNHFIRFFEGRIDDIKKISIWLEEFEEDGRKQPYNAIIFNENNE